MKAETDPKEKRQQEFYLHSDKRQQQYNVIKGLFDDVSLDAKEEVKNFYHEKYKMVLSKCDAVVLATNFRWLLVLQSIFSVKKI